MAKINISPTILLRLLIILFVAICYPGMAAAAGLDADCPNVSYYCNTADPLGITYTDSGQRMARVFIGTVSWIEQGPDGYLAAATPDTINICRQGKVMQSVSPTNEDYNLLGWRGNSVVFRESSHVHLVDPLTGALAAFSLGPDIINIACCPQGYLTIANSDNRVVLARFNGRGEKLSEWKTKGRGACGPTLALIGNRYAVAEIFAAGGGNDILEKSRLWIVDVQNKSEHVLDLKKPLTGFCAGRAANEMFIAQACAYDRMFNVTSTAITSVDLRTLKHREAFNAAGCINPVGVSRGGAWLIATRTYQISGPGRPCRLIGIRFSDRKIRILQENVYDCALDNWNSNKALKK